MCYYIELNNINNKEYENLNKNFDIKIIFLKI